MSLIEGAEKRELWAIAGKEMSRAQFEAQIESATRKHEAEQKVWDEALDNALSLILDAYPDTP